MTITYHRDLVQGSDEWLAARCGLLTASEMKLVVTPALKIASNDKERAHLYELLAQRITGHVEPRYVSEDMLRGQEDEIEARLLYARHNAPVEEMGFITNDEWGFTLGYSPDGLVGDDGAIECKSRRPKYQVQTIVENIAMDRGETVPDEFVMQCQTGLLVSKRKWIDLISYSAGLPAAIMRVYPIDVVQKAIIEGAGAFENRLASRLSTYRAIVGDLIPTERRILEEIF